MPRLRPPARAVPDTPQRDAAVPLYASLAQTLNEAITKGRYPVGALLPTEAELAASHAVSRQTVREALRRLEQQGLVSRRRGIGTRVIGAEPQRRYMLEIDSLSDIVEYARQVRLEVESIERVDATPQLAAHLACREGTRWLDVHGLRYPADGPHVPVAVVQMWIRAGYPGIERRLREIGGTAVHALLEQHYGEQIDEIRQDIVAIALDATVAARLGVATGSPGLKILRRFRGRSGRIVLVGHVIYPGDAFSYGGSFRRETGARS
jgi:GntR family transcriptional regulator